MRRSGTGQEELRRRNLAALLGQVHARGPTSRAALTSALGLNRSTIGDLTTQLEGAGLVREEPGHGTRSGRPSHLVVPRSEQVSVLGVRLDVDVISVARVGLGGVVLDRRDRRRERGGDGVRAVVISVAQLCSELLASPGAEASCHAVGVSVPGAVRASDGLVRFAPNLGWVDEPFTALLAEALRRPVASGNDSDLGGLAEHVRGAAADVEDVVYLNGGVGVGGGLLVGGVPLRGVGGYAGEVGHLPVNPLGRRCRCGARGCWETEVGEDSLLEAAGRLPGGGPLAVAEVVHAAEGGEERADRALTEVARWLGTGLGAIVNVLNPSTVVLGGTLARVHAARQNVVAASLARSSLAAPREQVRIRPAALGEDSPLIGAAELAFAPLLDDPLGRVSRPAVAG